ncbi:hypothetical protein F9L16_20035 [Agarivorans sp. B2Z047]|uniref:DUF6387 family protein n=1 Tax=Agarivorans sp. B2Z047 TaxID=2652721 RepID=UPI00128BABFA|nr:DUF6387 family protein [Agarivorans sp. B2Z047]MPW31267.1 hypothetical protein [Agarivorans sp. B2Z047]UQN42767.1 DUF6387 family protein [Agarivorans sp. B2Z047]
MPKIKYKSQLPSWYTESRYLSIKTKASNRQIEEELTARRIVHLQLSEGKLNTLEQAELFQVRVLQPEQQLTPNACNQSVEELNISHILDIASQIHIKFPTLIPSVCARKFASEHIDFAFSPLHKRTELGFQLGTSEVFAGVNLANSTDKELTEGFQKWLSKIRKETGIKQPKKFRINEKLELIFSCAVFEYLDLTLWAQSQKTTISNRLLATVIKPGKFTEKEISDKVRKHALEVISFEFSERLWNNIQ